MNTCRVRNSLITVQKFPHSGGKDRRCGQWRPSQSSHLPCQSPEWVGRHGQLIARRKILSMIWHEDDGGWGQDPLLVVGLYTCRGGKLNKSEMCCRQPCRWKEITSVRKYNPKPSSRSQHLGTADHGSQDYNTNSPSIGNDRPLICRVLSSTCIRLSLITVSQILTSNTKLTFSVPWKTMRLHPGGKLKW